MIKKSLKVIIFLIIVIPLFSEEPKVVLFHYNKYFTLEPIKGSFSELNTTYNALSDIDVSQRFRCIFTAIEKSRLLNNNYVGETTIFNNIEIKHIDTDKYQIIDQDNDIKIVFDIGIYDSIEIYSTIKFKDNKNELLEKLATIVYLKQLFSVINDTPQIKINIPEVIEQTKFEVEIILPLKDPEKKRIMTSFYLLDTKRSCYILTKDGMLSENRENIYKILDELSFKETGLFVDKKRIDAYENFVNQLKSINKKDLLKYLENFITLNFTISTLKDNRWLSPSDLYYTKESDYKSIALFYYYTLDKLKLPVKSYFINELSPRDKTEISIIEKKSDAEKNVLMIKYNNVDSRYNLNEVIKYYPPEITNSIYLVTVNINGEWIYTTGNKWISAGIRTADRVCSSYMKKGCYFTEVNQAEKLISNVPFMNSDVKWSIFFDTK